MKLVHLVDLLNGGAFIVTGTTSGATGTREATGTARTTGHTTRHATSATGTVELHHDGVGDTFELLLALLVLLARSLLVVIEPGDNLVDLGLELLLVGGVELLVNLLVREGVAERVGIRLETVLGSNTASLCLILLLVLLGLRKHTLDFLLGETALVVGDDNLVRLASALLDSGDVHDTGSINVEGDLNLGNTTGSRGNTGKLELAEQVVVLGALTLTLVNLDEHTGLVVGEGREDLGLLGRDGGVAGNELGHHTTSSLDTERERGDIEKQDLVGGLVGGVTGKDGSLDGSTVGNSLIGVDGLVGLLAVEVVRDEFLDTGDTGGTTDEDDVVDVGLVDLGIGEDAVDGLESGSEEVLAELLETGTGDGGVEVDTLEERVDLDGGLGRRRESTLGTLASSAKTTEGTSVGGEVLLVLALELVDEVLHQAVVHIFTTKMSVTSGSLDLEDTVLDGEEGDIESTTTKIEDEDVALTLVLLVETVGNGGRGGLVNDTEDIETGNETGILGSLTLRVVEVGGYSDDSLGNGGTEVALGSLSHLGEDHSGNLLGSELLGLALELDLDDRLATLVVLDSEGEVLHVSLDLGVVELASNKTLGIEDCVLGVHSDLVLGRVSDETLSVGESDYQKY
ncbi:hypothetical protein jhhlp_006855 [Lomentospora prolificans]|uniref:NAD-specific glutamate dehydrogenase n=1 Tax=Lomentospora prolificans TaxID=41688 RepID=A0A2N3N2X0_9PEZI|nr:hypothetical protein jhhlp_006855 [Lomentospora prolificans]